MSLVLSILGIAAIVIGVVMAGFGIPVKEFSFGNTLILAGVTIMTGGLIVIGLGAVVAHLRLLADAMSARARKPSPEMPLSAATSAAVSGRVPYPPRPRPSNRGVEQGAETQFAPMMRNPEEADEERDAFDEAPLSPRQIPPVVAPEFAEPARASVVSAPASPDRGNFAPAPMSPDIDDDRSEPPATSAPSSPPASYFDAMWPAETRSKADKPVESKPAARAEPAMREPQAAPAKRFEAEIPRRRPASETRAPAAEASRPFGDMRPSNEPPRPSGEMRPPSEAPRPSGEPRPASETRAVSILKSGTVDGMGYTLYVDGSIEAELPNGTVRFASINELRSHLEKNS